MKYYVFYVQTSDNGVLSKEYEEFNQQLENMKKQLDDKEYELNHLRKENRLKGNIHTNISSMEKKINRYKEDEMKQDNLIKDKEQAIEELNAR